MTAGGHEERHTAARPEGSLDGWVAFDLLVVLALLAAAGVYATAVVLSRNRSAWPGHRSLLWYLGLLCAGAALVGPVGEAARASFTGHMVAHLLLGMLAPLLLVLGAPVSLLLRALPVTVARRLTRILRLLPVRALTNPVVAGTLNAGGLWVLYATDLYPAVHTSVLLHGVVHAHILLAGYVFTAALIGVDPDPHQASVPVRSAVLVLFIAAHSVLAKWLYVHPPVGVGTGDGRTGAQLMYYGGDAVDVTLIALLLLGWYRATSGGRQSPSLHFWQRLPAGRGHPVDEVATPVLPPSGHAAPRIQGGRQRPRAGGTGAVCRALFWTQQIWADLRGAPERAPAPHGTPQLIASPGGATVSKGSYQVPLAGRAGTDERIWP